MQCALWSRRPGSFVHVPFLLRIAWAARLIDDPLLDPAMQAVLGADGTREFSQAMKSAIDPSSDIYGVAGKPSSYDEAPPDTRPLDPDPGQTGSQIKSALALLANAKSLGANMSGPAFGLTQSEFVKSVLSKDQRDQLDKALNPEGPVAKSLEALAYPEKDPTDPTLSGSAPALLKAMGMAKEALKSGCKRDDEEEEKSAEQDDCQKKEKPYWQKLSEMTVAKAKENGYLSSSSSLLQGAETATESGAPLDSSMPKFLLKLSTMPVVQQAIAQKPALLQELEHAIKKPEDAMIAFSDPDFGSLEKKVMARLPPAQQRELDLFEKELERAARVPAQVAH